MGILAKFDLFDKLADRELSSSTKQVKALTVCLFVLWSVLFIAELRVYLTLDVFRDLSLESENLAAQPDLVNISLSIEIGMPCWFLHIDSMDSTGFDLLDINTTVTFRRLDARGTGISVTKREKNETCLPCYDLLPEGDCCPTCDMLVFIAARQGKSLQPEQWVQCKLGSDHIEGRPPDEKCLIKGKLSVNRVKGSFHIAPGRNVRLAGGHVHDMMMRTPVVNLSHRIERLRFGPKMPTVSQPLEGFRFREKVPTNSLYLLMASPVTYKRDGRFVDKGFEYTSTDKHTGHEFFRAPPGLFFYYQFSPYRVIVTERSRSFASFFGSTCGILAGSYALASLFALYFHI
jgi:hypothetical protein